MMTPPACCGNCTPTIERSDPASTTFSKATVMQDVLAAVALASDSFNLIEALPQAISVQVPPRFLPPADRLPLRL